MERIVFICMLAMLGAGRATVDFFWSGLRDTWHKYVGIASYITYFLMLGKERQQHREHRLFMTPGQINPTTSPLEMSE